MKVNEISKYNFPEISRPQSKPVNNEASVSAEIRDRYQKGLNSENVTYSPDTVKETKKAVLSAEEKDFFGKLYPESSNQIGSYQVFKYNTNSIVGQIIDKKG